MYSRMTTGLVARAALALAVGLAATAASADTLRVCADPDNLPFSKSEGPEHGLYVDLAQQVATRLGSQVEFTWWLSFNQRKALRNTILDDGCDAYFALPADRGYRVRGLGKTRPFLDLSYALVAPAQFSFAGLSDLRGKRIGVLFGSPPHVLLASENLDTRSFREQAEVVAALTRGDIDGAILWGPSIGYENQRHQGGRWRVTPVSGLGMAGAVAVAVPASKPELLARIDQALETLRPQIVELARRYGFPQDTPVAIAQQSRQLAQPRSEQALTWRTRDAAAAPARTGFIRVAATTEAAAAGNADVGRTFFNNSCSHCHGTNGASPVSERDVRRLRLRYKDNWQEVARTTILNGRPQLGMPTWKGTTAEAELDNIIAFFGTIQR